MGFNNNDNKQTKKCIQTTNKLHQRKRRNGEMTCFDFFHRTYAFIVLLNRSQLRFLSSLKRMNTERSVFMIVMSFT